MHILSTNTRILLSIHNSIILNNMCTWYFLIRAHFVPVTLLHEAGKKVQNFQFGLPSLQKGGYGPESVNATVGIDVGITAISALLLPVETSGKTLHEQPFLSDG